MKPGWGTSCRSFPPISRASTKPCGQLFFPFFRATFYRWAQLYPEVCADCADAPEVLAVGDLHVENFRNVARLRSPLGLGH